MGHRLRCLGLLVLLASACDGGMASSPDGGNGTSRLALELELRGAKVNELTISGGHLELDELAVFGDVAVDSRTMLAKVQLALPSALETLLLPDAPYGLYSRVRAEIDKLEINGTWRGRSLEVRLDVEDSLGEPDTTVDLRGPSLDYGPASDAAFKVAIDASSWFDPAALDAASIEDGVIRIDGVNNAALVSQLLRAIRGSFAFAGTATAM